MPDRTAISSNLFVARFASFTLQMARVLIRGTYEGTWRCFTLPVCTEVPRQGNLIDPTPFSPLLSMLCPFTAKKSR